MAIANLADLVPKLISAEDLANSASGNAKAKAAEAKAADIAAQKAANEATEVKNQVAEALGYTAEFNRLKTDLDKVTEERDAALQEIINISKERDDLKTVNDSLTGPNGRIPDLEQQVRTLTTERDALQEDIDDPDNGWKVRLAAAQKAQITNTPESRDWLGLLR